MFNNILYIYPIIIKHISQDLPFKGYQIADNKLHQEKSHVQHGQQPSSNWCVQLYEDSYTYMLHSTLRLESGKNIGVWMLEIDYITGYSAHTPGRTYSCENRRNWKPSATTSAPPLPIFHRRDHFSNLWTNMRTDLRISSLNGNFATLNPNISEKIADRCFVMESVSHATEQGQTTPHESGASTAIRPFVIS